MTRRIHLALSIAVSLTSFVVAAQNSPAEALFQRGLLLERAEGNVQQAIVLYERVIAEFPKDTTVVPQALYHLARAYENSDKARAVRLWMRLTTEFASTQYADEGRRHLVSLQAQPLGPFKSRNLDTTLAVLDQFESKLSPDGKLVLYLKPDATKGDTVWLRDIATGRDRQVFSESHLSIENIEWMPDSRRVGFLTDAVAFSPENAPKWQDLRLLTVATGQVQSLAKGEGVYHGVGYWASPDNTHILIHLGKVGETLPMFQVIDINTGVSRTFGSGSPGNLTWSPDGSQFAFQTTVAQKDEFWIGSVLSAQVRRFEMPLTVTGPTDRVNIAAGITNGKAWRSNDRLMVRQVAANGATFYLVPIGGGAPVRACTALQDVKACNMLTNDDAHQVATSTSTRRVMLLDLPAGSERRVSTGFGDEETPMLSDDGRLLAYMSNQDGKWALNVVPLDKVPATPVQIAVLTEHPASASKVVWARDGRLIVDFFYSDENIYRINMDRSGHPTGLGGRLTQDSNFANSPAVSPDANSIAYRFRTGTKIGVAVMSAEGSGERPILDLNVSDHFEWLSSDEVLFNRPGAGSPATVAALNVKTGAVRPFADFANGFNWQYVPSRNEIVYVQGAPNVPSRTIRARSLKDGADRAIVTVDGMINFRFTFRVSKDGRFVAYGRANGTGPTRKIEMHVVSIDGQNDHIVATATPGNWRPSGFPYDWSPDGKFLLYDDVPGQLRVLEIATGQSWSIKEAIDGDGHEWSGAQWSPDGSYIVLSRSGGRDEYRQFDGVTYDSVVKLAAAAASQAKR